MASTARPGIDGSGITMRQMILPLALCQFIASYAATNMNVAISDIAHDLNTSVTGVQQAITLFTLTMAALMVPGSKLTDIWGRKFCFMLGLLIYGAGGIIAALATSKAMLIVGYSFGEGIGSALMIPPIYITVTVAISDLTLRAKGFGIVSGAAGLGSATGPLIGGLITSLISWRASFITQVLVVFGIILLTRKLPDPPLPEKKPAFDLWGAIISGAGLFLVVIGILQASTYSWFRAREDFTIGNTVIIHQGGISPVWLFVIVGAVVLGFFFWHIRSREKAGKSPLLATKLFKNKASNLGLITQNVQWLIMQGSFFVISVFFQEVRNFSAVKTGLILTSATAGVLIASARAQRMATRFPQKTLITAGFVFSLAGQALVLLITNSTSSYWTFVPGLFLIGFGVGIMLTASVNVVQSAWPSQDQGEISGLSRSISNLGSSLGTAIAGSALVSTLVEGNAHYAYALLVMIVFGGIGLLAALFLPRTPAGEQPFPAEPVGQQESSRNRV